MATNLQSGSLTERLCSGGYTKKLACFEGGTQVGNYLRALNFQSEDCSTLAFPFGTTAAEYGWFRNPVGFGTDAYGTTLAGFRIYTIRPPDQAYNEAQASGGYTKKIVRVIAASGALDFLAVPLTSTSALDAVTLQRGCSYVHVPLAAQGVIPAVGFQRGCIVQVEPLGSSSAIQAPAITAARTLGPVQFSTTTTLSGKVSTPVIIQGVQFRSTTIIPIASGIGIRPAPVGPPITPGQIKGSSVSFKDFTLGWAELHRFMDVNEWSTDAPSMTMDNGGTNIRGWTGGQDTGMCIPGVQTADLATAWEAAESGGGGNYSF